MASQTSQKKGRTADRPEPCPECGGSGYSVSKDGTLARCACGALQTHLADQRFRAARIPERYLHKSLATFQARDPQRRKILEAAKAYANGFHHHEETGLLFRGKTGVGKTHIAIGILRDIIQKGHTGIYCNVTELLARLRSTYEDDAEEAESQVLEEYIACELLVLDDLGNESTSAWVLDRLYLLINRRYESSRPVIVTTNCNEKELNDKVGPRIASRLYEMCGVKFPDFPTEDYRIKMLR